jgi:hypothetical protein
MQPPTLHDLDTGLISWAHSDPRLASWSLCAGLSTLAFQATKSPSARRRRMKRGGGTDPRIARFMEKGGLSLPNIQRSAVPRSRAEREDLVILPRVRRAHNVAKGRGRRFVRDRNTNTKMPTELAKSAVLRWTSGCHNPMPVQRS